MDIEKYTVVRLTTSVEPGASWLFTLKGTEKDMCEGSTLRSQKCTNLMDKLTELVIVSTALVDVSEDRLSLANQSQ